jgi:hypothetical protein
MAVMVSVAVDELGCVARLYYRAWTGVVLVSQGCVRPVLQGFVQHMCCRVQGLCMF